MQRFCTEVVIWRKLAHPNILPLLGISTNGGNLCMISRLMSHGTIMAYLSTRPSANRLMLVSPMRPKSSTPSKSISWLMLVEV